MIETEQLVQLAAFARYGTLSKAAEALHISQPSLSRTMQALEGELPSSPLSALEVAGAEAKKGVQQAFDALDHVPADRAELALVIRRHAFLARRYSPLLALLKMRTFVPRYVKNLDGARALRQQIVSCTSWEELDDILERHFCDTSN